MTEPRKVLVLNQAAVPLGAPGGTRHAELFSRLRGWQPVIVAGDRNLLTRQRSTIGDTSGSFRFVRVPPYTGNSVARILSWACFALTSFWAGVREPQVRMVYASSPYLLAGMSGWAIAKVRRLPFVFEVRDLWPKVLIEMGQLRASSWTARTLALLERFLYRQAGAVVVLAEGSVAEVVASGAHPDRVFLIPNGADPKDFRCDEHRDALRRELGFDGFTVLYAGAHGPANGLQFVLDAAAELQDAHEKASFVLVGDGVDKASLVEQARDRGLDHVLFLDPVPKSMMPRLLKASDVGLHVLADVPLFRHGVSPNKVFDYLAAGKPTLTNCPGEVAALVREAGAGIGVVPGGIAEGVRWFLARPEELERMGADGQRFVIEHRSRRAAAEFLERVLNEVALAKARRSRDERLL